MKLVKYTEYFVSTVNNDGQMLYRQGLSSHIAEYALMCFKLFMV